MPARAEVAAEGFFDDHAPESCRSALLEQAALAEVIDDGAEKPRRHREIKHGAARRRRASVGELLVGVGLIEVGRT